MEGVMKPIRSRRNWQVYGILLVLYIVGFAAGIPFVLSVQEYTSARDVWVDVLEGFLPGVAILVLGLMLSTNTGLGTPFIESWLHKDPRKPPSKLVVSLSVLVVIAANFILVFLRQIVAVLAIAFGADVSAVVSDSTDFLSSYPETWKWLSVSFHAGVIEEIMFRLGLMNLLVWIGHRLVSANKRSSRRAVIWIANLIAALVFGAFHLVGVLPVPDVLFAKVSVVVQNTLVGLVFGWFFWKFGLESAMLTHFLLDVFFYVVMIPVLMTANFALILAWLAITAIALVVSFKEFSKSRKEWAWQ